MAKVTKGGNDGSDSPGQRGRGENHSRIAMAEFMRGLKEMIDGSFSESLDDLLSFYRDNIRVLNQDFARFKTLTEGNEAAAGIVRVIDAIKRMNDPLRETTPNNVPVAIIGEKTPGLLRNMSDAYSQSGKNDRAEVYSGLAEKIQKLQEQIKKEKDRNSPAI